MTIKALDYSLKTANERTEQVARMLDTNPISTLDSERNRKTLETMANYILYAKDNPKIDITPKNNSFASKKKIVSLEGALENTPETSFSALDTTQRATYRYPKPKITAEDLKNPHIRELREGIEYLESVNVHPKGTLLHYRLRHLFIAMRKEQYALKDIFSRTIQFLNARHYQKGDIDWEQDTYYTDDSGRKRLVSSNTIDFGDPHHVYMLIKHYSALRQHCAENMQSNTRYMLDSFDEVIGAAGLSDARMWVVIREIDGASNDTIRYELQMMFGLDYQSNYISVIFKQEICAKIAFTGQLLNDKWEHRNDPTKWKNCSWCGVRKLRDEREFVRKKTTYDGLSGRCKVCDKNWRENKNAAGSS